MRGHKGATGWSVAALPVNATIIARACPNGKRKMRGPEIPNPGSGIRRRLLLDTGTPEGQAPPKGSAPAGQRVRRRPSSFHLVCR